VDSEIQYVEVLYRAILRQRSGICDSGCSTARHSITGPGIVSGRGSRNAQRAVAVMSTKVGSRWNDRGGVVALHAGAQRLSAGSGRN
jgi:hypothetical protein